MSLGLRLIDPPTQPQQRWLTGDICSVVKVAPGRAFALARAACKTQVRRIKASHSNAEVWVTPNCSVGFKIRFKIVANEAGMTKTTWRRTWKVKNKPKTYRRLTGNG